MVSRHCINSLQQGKAFLMTDLSRKDLTVYFEEIQLHLQQPQLATVGDKWHVQHNHRFKDQNHQSFLKGHIQSKKLFWCVVDFTTIFSVENCLL